LSTITDKGQDFALQQLEERKKINKDRKRINNAELHAGSPMYYYCRVCGEVIILPETHTCPAPTHCVECDALIVAGWMST